MFDRSILVRVWITCIIISNSNIWIPFLFTPFTPISLACMLLQVAITLFSPAYPHAHFMFLLSSQTWSLDVSLEKCHTLLSLYITRFSLYLTSLLFSSITRYLSFLFHRHTHSLHSSFTLSFSLWDSLTHPICLYIWLIPLKLLSLSRRHNICCGLLFVSIPDWHYSFVYRSDNPDYRLVSLSHRHTQLLLPLPFPTTVSLSHTQNSCFRTLTRISLTNIYRLASL